MIGLRSQRSGFSLVVISDSRRVEQQWMTEQCRPYHRLAVYSVNLVWNLQKW